MEMLKYLEKLLIWPNCPQCIKNNDSMPCVIGGYFNIIRNSSEKNKPTGNNHWNFVFNAITEHARPRELPLNGRNFTWEK